VDEEICKRERERERDHVCALHVVSEIQCAAARIVQAVRQHSLVLSTTITKMAESLIRFLYSTRRFSKHKATPILPAIQIYNISKNGIPEGSTVYDIGKRTNEIKTFF
jgi:hypothetical protein